LTTVMSSMTVLELGPAREEMKGVVEEDGGGGGRVEQAAFEKTNS